MILHVILFQKQLNFSYILMQWIKFHFFRNLTALVDDLTRITYEIQSLTFSCFWVQFSCYIFLVLTL